MKNTTAKGCQIYFSPPYIMLLSSVKSSTLKIIILNDVFSDYPEDFTIIADFLGGGLFSLYQGLLLTLCFIWQRYSVI